MTILTFTHITTRRQTVIRDFEFYVPKSELLRLRPISSDVFTWFFLSVLTCDIVTSIIVLNFVLIYRDTDVSHEYLSFDSFTIDMCFTPT